MTCKRLSTGSLPSIGANTSVTHGIGRLQSNSGAAFMLSLPPSCKLAAVHAGLVCAGQTPEYAAIPGFAPLSYSWGWLVVGTILGSVLTSLLLSLAGLLRREPSITTLAAMAHPPTPHRPPPGLTSPRDRAREDVLTYVAGGGRPALTELSTASGMSEIDFLLTLLGDRPRRALPGHVMRM